MKNLLVSLVFFLVLASTGYTKSLNKDFDHHSHEHHHDPEHFAEEEEQQILTKSTDQIPEKVEEIRLTREILDEKAEAKDEVVNLDFKNTQSSSDIDREEEQLEEQIREARHTHDHHEHENELDNEAPQAKSKGNDQTEEHVPEHKEEVSKREVELKYPSSNNEEEFQVKSNNKDLEESEELTENKQDRVEREVDEETPKDDKDDDQEIEPKSLAEPEPEPIDEEASLAIRKREVLKDEVQLPQEKNSNSEQLGLDDEEAVLNKKEDEDRNRRDLSYGEESPSQRISLDIIQGFIDSLNAEYEVLLQKIRDWREEIEGGENTTDSTNEDR